VTRYTITCAHDEVYNPDAVDVATGLLAAQRLAGTVTPGSGYHPDWGVEPVVVVVIVAFDDANVDSVWAFEFAQGGALGQE
jgi:hypothetical protein